MDSEKQLLYRLWLNICCDHNPKQINRLLKEFGSLEEIFKMDFHKPPLSKYLKLGQRLKVSHNLSKAKNLLEYCKENGIKIISIDMEEYPQRLKEVFAPPQILYVKGMELDFNKIFGVSVVGTRAGSEDGEKFAGKLGMDLATSGATIISGMAVGMDAAAHWGALEKGGTTIAVLAGGVDMIYPLENADLYEHILTHGCIVSEQPPGKRGEGVFYQQRNRIIVGLSHAVAIVEGKNRSGTSLTARLAKESNADIFAVPGNPMNAYSELPNSLIQDGCMPLTSAFDIIETYIGTYPEKLEYGNEKKGKPVIGKIKNEKPDNEKKKEKADKIESVSVEEFEDWLSKDDRFSAEEKIILRFLWEKKEPVSYDEIADNCRINAAQLGSMLIILQMKKAVVPSAGGQYELERIGG